MVKKLSFLILLLFFALLLPPASPAQSFNAGLRNYEQRNYEQAAAIFAEINSPQATLFAAKSYYASGHFNKAEDILNNLLQNAGGAIYYEAAYTSALIDFQQKQYDLALMKLSTVFSNSQNESLSNEARTVYDQILSYLSAHQRIEAIRSVTSPQIKYQLVESAAGRVRFSSLKKLINVFYESADDGKWTAKVQSIEASLTSEPAYKIEFGGKDSPTVPPDGTVYNIGILLPKLSNEKPTYPVVQGIYLGARLAAEQFNDRHSDVKVYFDFLPSKSGDLEQIVQSFATESYGDIIIGPLFSEQAEEIVPLSVEYSIPIIAPLATSSLPSKGSLFYQANSTFAVHGKKMATFAVKKLGLHTFAVIAGRNTSGAKSAKAFREKAEALGAKVILFQLKDFEKSEYDISAYVKKIGSKLTSVDAVYAPFTSSYTPYLVEQLIYAANAFKNPITLLGSQKWGNVDFSTDVYARGNIYFTTNTYRNEDLNDFHYRYRRAFNHNPNKYAVIGYDVANYILQLLDKVGNPALLNEAIQSSEFYRGLIKNIYFNGKHVNQAVKILKVGSGGYPSLISWHQ